MQNPVQIGKTGNIKLLRKLIKSLDNRFFVVKYCTFMICNRLISINMIYFHYY